MERPFFDAAFGSLRGPILERFGRVFGVVFRCFLGPFFGAVVTERNVSSIQYLLCFSHIGLTRKRQNKGRKARQCGTPVRGASGSGFGGLLGAILGAFWEPCWPQNRKNGCPEGGPKTDRKKRRFQVMRHGPGRPGMARQRGGGGPLKQSTFHAPDMAS